MSTLCAAWTRAALAFVLLSSSAAAEPYRMTLLRAAPGRLLDLVAAIKAGPAREGLVLRHSQGDQWDLMVLLPLESKAPLSSDAALASLASGELVAWREDELVRGPAFATLAPQGTALCHVEMFVALPGKREALVKQREMENAYLAALARPQNAVFVGEWGASWDVFTLGAYRGWKHYAERDDIPPEKSTAAAKQAGFEGDDRIGPYLRSLIQTHHDTLATPIR